MATTRSEAGVTAVACSEVGDEAVACSVAGIEDGRQHCATGLGSRTTGGGGMTVSRMTKERELLVVSKNC
jgi:hypothetical protein